MTNSLVAPLRERISQGQAKESVKSEVIDLGYTEEEFESAYNEALTLQDQGNKDTQAPLNESENSPSRVEVLPMVALFIFAFMCIGGVIYLVYTYFSPLTAVNELATEVEQGNLLRGEGFEANEVAGGENDFAQTESTQEEVRERVEEERTFSSEMNTVDNAPAPKAQISSSDPWEIFEMSKKALREKDIQSLNAISYHEYPSCDVGDTPCVMMLNSGIDFMLEGMEKYKKEDFIHKWEDEKQIIWTTGPMPSDEGFTQVSIFFVYNTGDQLKLLSVGYSTANHIDYFTDTDKDGLRDEKEILTNPNLRDTDGNGYWDGIQLEMERQR